MNWKVTKKGMERRGYIIDASRYNEIANYVGPWCSDWLIHIALTKVRWDLEEFISCFSKAMQLANISPTFDWGRSVAYARERRREHQEYDQIHRELFPPTGEIVATPLSEFLAQHDAVEMELKRRHGRA